MQRFPSVLYFKSPRDPHKNFLRVQGQISRVLNPEIFLMHIQLKDQNILLMFSVTVILQNISQIYYQVREVAKFTSATKSTFC